MKSKLFTYLKWFMPLCYLLSFAPLVSHSSESTSQNYVRQELTEMGSGEIPVQADLITPETSIQPGKPFWVGIHMHMSKDWATYWKNPGDSGAATQIKWQLPEGFQAGPIHWPTPEKFDTDGLIGYGYSDDVVLLSQITPPKYLPMNTDMDIGADVSWIACNDSCVPGAAHLSLSLKTSEQATPEKASVAHLIAQSKQKLPLSLTSDQAHVSASIDKNSIVVNFKPSQGVVSEIKSATFYPETQDVINMQKGEQWTKADQGYSLTLTKSDLATSLPSHLQGILLLKDNSNSVKAIQVNVPLQGQAAVSSGSTYENPEAMSSLGLAMVLAFVGGLILNMMPCVLPVIALKIFGFVKLAQQKRSVILKHGAVYSLGVLVSFWVLSGALLLLRAYGAGIGWGFQLQEPIFVVGLAVVLFLLGLSLFGVFELGASLITLGQRSSTSSPMTGSFFSGVLATLVATPCTGPLLGPALGFAITLAPISALLVFTCMGLGMAAPYLIFSGFPRLIRFLPKPGNWMITFKQLMGFLMMATVVWLIWVFGAQTSMAAVFALLVSFLVLSVGAWIFGHWGTPARKRLVRAIGIFIASLTLLGGGGIAVYSAKQLADEPAIAHESKSSSESGWQTYSPEKVNELRSQGKAVFVDFTAKWCLICQANKVTLHSAEVDKAFNQSNVVTMVADWTKNDPMITKELQKFGRSGVPLYVLYPADPGQDPYILPQTLTSTIVGDYLQKLQNGNVITAHAD